MANITGTLGSDQIEGTELADRIEGLAGGDRINGHGGDDRILGGDGVDQIDGGGGDDYILSGRDRDLLSGAAGNDVVQGNDGNDTIDGGAGNDLLFGGDNTDSLFDGPGDDRLFGGGGDDVLLIGGFFDTFAVGGGHDVLAGGPGRDTFYIYHDDRITSLGAQNTVVTDFDRADDLLELTAFNPDDDGYSDLPFGFFDTNENGILDDGDQAVGIGQVVVDGVSKLSTMIELPDQSAEVTDHDTLTLFGVTGISAGAFDRDRFIGPYLRGGGGSDHLIGTDFSDELDGNAGNDTLYGLGGTDYLYGGDGKDSLYGGSGDDILSGQAGADRLFGGAGQDWLIADDGVDAPPITPNGDYLSGGLGDDRLTAGFGRDVLDGGGGRDVFGLGHVGIARLDGQPLAAETLIVDFKHGEDALEEYDLSFARYDANGDGRIKGSDPYVTLERVTHNDESKISLVIYTHGYNIGGLNTTVATAKLTLFGITELTAADFTSASN